MTSNETELSKPKPSWAIYILRCADGSLYTGVTTDLNRRVQEHNHCNRKGAKYTRCRRPLTLAYSEKELSKQQAYQREYAIKKMTKAQKELLICNED